MRLVDWAKQQGISYMTAWRWFHQGKLPLPAIQTETGMILVQPEKTVPEKSKATYCYCRVSSSQKKRDLKRQAVRCKKFCNANGWAVDGVVLEIASGMNDHRPKLLKLLKNKPSRIVVEHKDRLTRFGFHYFDTLLPMLDCELVVMNRDKEEEDDLIKDLVAIVTSFCCRLYGMRRGRNKAKKIISDAQKN